jgi:ferritin-like metal-binding protein YciE
MSERSLLTRATRQNVVGPLEETLKEEKAADAKLTQLGESLLNTKARSQTA